MNKLSLFCLSSVACFTLIAAKPTTTIPVGKVFARADLEGKSGTPTSGIAEFIAQKDGVKVEIRVENAVAGKHGIHIHEKGDCTPDDASNAGDHFNPSGEKHGSPLSSSRHLGDLGNIEIGADGKGSLSMALRGEPAIFLNRSVVVHSKEDDLKTQPAGDSGSRIACGVVLEVKDYAAAKKNAPARN